MPAVRIKICGITRVEDALAAAAGADAIGLVFYAKSPRVVDIHRAREIVRALPPFVTSVGLFVNASRCELGEILDAVPLDLLQFHGDERAEDCEGHRRPYLKALRMKPGDDIVGARRHIRELPGFSWIPMWKACPAARGGVRLVAGAGRPGQTPGAGRRSDAG